MTNTLDPRPVEDNTEKTAEISRFARNDNQYMDS